MTPEKLREIAVQAREPIFEKELELFEVKLLAEAKMGSSKVLIPAPTVPGLFYHIDRQEVFAKYLKDKGYEVRLLSEIIGGVRQDPSWYLVI